MKKIKDKKVIMLLSNAFSPDVRVYQEARTLIRSGFSVTVLAWDRTREFPEFEEIDGIKVERIHSKSSYGRGSSQIIRLPLFWLKILLRGRKKELEFVHAHDLDTLLPGYFLARWKRKKIIYDSHENYPLMMRKNISRFIIFFLEKLENFLLKRVDAIITAVGILKEDFSKKTNKMIEVIGNWKELDEFNIDEFEINKLKEERNLQAKLILSYIGNFGEERLIAPLIEVVKDDPQVLLLLAGDGVQKNNILKMIEKVDNIIYLGRIPLKEVPLYTGVSDVVCYFLSPEFPAIKYNAPNNLYAALVAGKAILTNNVGETGRVVSDYNCGLALDNPIKTEIEKAIKKLKEENFLNKLKSNARKAAEEKYNWKFAEKKLIELYKQLRGQES